MDNILRKNNALAFDLIILQIVSTIITSILISLTLINNFGNLPPNVQVVYDVSSGTWIRSYKEILVFLGLIPVISSIIIYIQNLKIVKIIPKMTDGICLISIVINFLLLLAIYQIISLNN